MIDRKLEPLVKRLMVKYLGELEDDDLVMFVLEHLKDHKGPHKLTEGLEPVSLPWYLLSNCDSSTGFDRCSRKRPRIWQSASGGKLSSRVWPTAKAYTPSG